MRAQDISAFLRKFYLAKTADHIRFYYKRVRSRKQFRAFRAKYPDVKLPPDYLIYESFQLNYFKYYEDGLESAVDVIKVVEPYLDLSNMRILDWGCGPARILRHMPKLLGTSNEYYGSDYNHRTINWCRKNIPGIEFEINGLLPPLKFGRDFFSFIYGISVLTHLSEANQRLWIRELWSVCKPNGVVLLTTHGEAFFEKMTEEEVELFKKNEIVSRGKVLEGHRMYGAFHPPEYMKSVFQESGFDILDHIPGKWEHESLISQDHWVLRKVV